MQTCFVSLFYKKGEIMKIRSSLFLGVLGVVMPSGLATAGHWDVTIMDQNSKFDETVAKDYDQVSVYVLGAPYGVFGHGKGWTISCEMAMGGGAAGSHVLDAYFTADADNERGELEAAGSIELEAKAVVRSGKGMAQAKCQLQVELFVDNVKILNLKPGLDLTQQTTSSSAGITGGVQVGGFSVGVTPSVNQGKGSNHDHVIVPIPSIDVCGKHVQRIHTTHASIKVAVDDIFLTTGIATAKLQGDIIWDYFHLIPYCGLN